MTDELVASERYYREMSKKPGVPARQKRVWLQLADELAHRLGYDAPSTVQEDISSLAERPEKEQV